MGGPGVLRTPGRRPPHRNGGARRLSGYAAKSRSDAPTGGAQASPFPCFRPPFRRPMQKGWGLAVSPHSHERTTINREDVKKKAAKLSRQVSCTATPARANKEKNSVSGAAGRGVSRRLGGAGKPARPILAAWAEGRGAGVPARRAAGQGCWDPRRATAPGRPARPILAAWAARESAGFPAKRVAREGAGLPAKKAAPAGGGCGRRPQKSPRRAGAWTGRKARG